MTIAPSLCPVDRQRLRAATTARGAVVASLAIAAIQIDEGVFAAAQTTLLGVLNDLAAHGADVPMEARDAVASVRGRLDGHRYQVCTLRCCLDMIEALHVNPRATSMGERVGRTLHALATLRADGIRLDMAA